MKTCLLFIGLASLLSACQRIELSVSQTPIPDQEFSYKTYQDIGNTCQATDGRLVTVLIGTGSNRPPGQYTSTNLYVERKEVTVVKTDLQGLSVWTRLVWAGSAYNSTSSRPSILPMSDGGYAVFLSFQQYKPGTSLVIVRLSNTGDVLSQQPLVGLQVTDAFIIQKVVVLPDKGFIISARTSFSNPNLVLLRFDERAQLLWSRKYEPSLANTNTYSMAATSDGGLIVAWSGYNSATSQYETYLLKTALDGQQSWVKKYALAGADPVISESSDKGYVLLERGVSTSTNPANLILVKLDKEAAVQWSKLYAPSGSQYVIPRSVFATSDTYVALYSGYSNGMELLTTDLSGAEQSRQSINGPTTSDTNSDVLRLSDGSFVYNGRSPQGQFSLTKTKPDKTLHWTVPITTSK